jgi:hypothetical protein
MHRTVIPIAIVLLVLYVLLTTRKQRAPVAAGVAHLPQPFAPPLTGTPTVALAGPSAETPVMAETYPGSGVTIPVYSGSQPTWTPAPAPKPEGPSKQFFNLWLN